METLTQQMADAAWAIIEEVEAMGGMTKAVQSGWAKLKIEASAAEKQARIDSGLDTIVGVNKYKLDEEAAIDTLAIDNHAVRDNQVARLKALRAARDGGVKAAARRAHRVREDRQRQPARPHRPGDAPARHGRRGERRARGCLGPAPCRHAEGLRRLRRPPTTAPRAGSS
jgi:methylmalonyl-CoA mutase N-terminal domain/subunit